MVSELFNWTKAVRCGVPQGYILAPLLFLIYINNFPSVCEHTMPILFAGDTNLFINGDDLWVRAQILNTELENISHWLKSMNYLLMLRKLIILYLLQNALNNRIMSSRLEVIRLTKYNIFKSLFG